MTNEIRLVLEKLNSIQSDLDYIKEHMVDIDSILTPEEEKRLEESLKNLKEGNTTSLGELKREMKKHVKN